LNFGDFVLCNASHYILSVWDSNWPYKYLDKYLKLRVTFFN